MEEKKKKMDLQGGKKIKAQLYSLIPPGMDGWMGGQGVGMCINVDQNWHFVNPVLYCGKLSMASNLPSISQIQEEGEREKKGM